MLEATSQWRYLDCQHHVPKLPLRKLRAMNDSIPAQKAAPLQLSTLAGYECVEKLALNLLAMHRSGPFLQCSALFESDHAKAIVKDHGCRQVALFPFDQLGAPHGKDAVALSQFP